MGKTVLIHPLIAYGGGRVDIIMIRHGESEDNVKRVFGTFESPLSEKGKEEIKRTRETLKEFEFEKVYYSPFKRAIQTYQILGLKGEEDSRIGEYDFGIFSGLDSDGIEEKYPGEYKKWISDPTEYVIKEGESLDMAYNRVVKFLEEIIEKDESVVLVSHAGIIRLAFCWVLGNIDNFLQFKVGNGSINVISIEEGKPKTIERTNYNP